MKFKKNNKFIVKDKSEKVSIFIEQTKILFEVNESFLEIFNKLPEVIDSENIHELPIEGTVFETLLEVGMYQRHDIEFASPQAFSHFDYYQSWDEIEGKVCLLGAPFFSKERSVFEGPDSIRTYLLLPDDDSFVIDYEFKRKVYYDKTRCLDFGNLEITDESRSSLESITREIFAKKGVPLVLGGDHSLTYSLLNAATKEFDKIGIIHFDAHHDLYGEYPVSEKDINKGNFLYPFLDNTSVSSITQIGIREYYFSKNKEKKHLHVPTFYSAREVEEGKLNFLNSLDKGIPYYITFDIDALTPTLGVETGTPVVGGLSYYNTLNIVDQLVREFDIIGMDIVEVESSLDSHNYLADTAAQIALRLILNQFESEPMKNKLEW